MILFLFSLGAMYIFLEKFIICFLGRVYHLFSWEGLRYIFLEKFIICFLGRVYHLFSLKSS